ncbi:Nitrogen regulatory protein P-II [Variovorax sp. SRS16]|uniref:P-II family nitrogen regulator n=1 Tax=Variovorax sp. SRS16 TaxID=282217 RepID=UPI0013170BA5|nr:P-II family nitrogen regulator [Variovorax sp. SRS16]VTU31279.1 Nitrogen regulatory protein P-II [Variovorax sp. SRS16]
MKQITAVIRPHRLEAVEAALHELPHLPGFTLFPSQGHPRGHGHDHHFANDEWKPDSHQQTVLMVFCADADAQSIVEAIANAAYTGHNGDGIVGVSELTDVVRIRTGERGDAAL